MEGSPNLAVLVLAAALVTSVLHANAALAETDLVRQVAQVFEGEVISVADDGSVVTIEWKCPGADEEETYCIAASMRMYMTAMEAIRDHKIDVQGRALNFKTTMHRRKPGRADSEILMLATSWDGPKLMSTDWKTTSISEVLDSVAWVHADKNFPTAFALGEVCNSMYGGPPRFCALAKLAARR